MRRSFAIALAGLAAPLALAAQTAGSEPLPRTHQPQPTVPAITAGDLMTRLYIYADDSMMGREAGTIGNVKATDYIAQQVRRFGLRPGGEKGSYFQTVAMVRRGPDTTSALSVDGTSFRLGQGFAMLPTVPGVLPFGNQLRGDSIAVIYGGVAGDSVGGISAEQARGKLVVLSAPADQEGMPGWQFWRRGHLDRWAGAAGVAVASLDQSPPQFVAFLGQQQEALDQSDSAAASGPVGLVVSSDLAARLMGGPLDSLQPGAAGRVVAGSVQYRSTPVPYPARNVIAILPGRDPRLKGQYVAIGAHNDHVGMSDVALDHDSVRVFNRLVRPRGANDRGNEATPAQLDTIRAELDSIRRIRPVRRDSIYNGADDDGSGTVSVLEIAQYMASLKGKAVPRRSVLFIWHTGEEKGLYGSKWFTDHPTVPRDSIVAQLNIDMFGRGRAEDTPGGGPTYIDAIGSRRLSTELGDIVDSVNAQEAEPMNIDYSFDAPGHPMNRYCRSDHYMYARYGIPIVFFSTAYSVDYHMVTDEPQYIDYQHMARNARFVRDVLQAVANRDHRPVVDHPKPDPNAACRQ